MSTKQEQAMTTEAQTGHSPLPWDSDVSDKDEIWHKVYDSKPDERVACIFAGQDEDGDDIMIARTYGENALPNAELIVRAVNAFDDLVAACEAILPYLSTESELLDYAATNDGQASGYDVASKKIRAALKKARP